MDIRVRVTHARPHSRMLHIERNGMECNVCALNAAAQCEDAFLGRTRAQFWAVLLLFCSHIVCCSASGKPNSRSERQRSEMMDVRRCLWQMDSTQSFLYMHAWCGCEERLRACIQRRPLCMLLRVEFPSRWSCGGPPSRDLWYQICINSRENTEICKPSLCSWRLE